MALVSQSHRRRRRRRSLGQEQAAQQAVEAAHRQPFQLPFAETLASAGIVIAAMTVIILVWINCAGSIESERTASLAHVEATLTSDSLVLAEEVRRELLGVEQSLRVLRAIFQKDPDHFDLRAWREQIPVLTDVTDDVFIVDNDFVIQHDLNPNLKGLGLASPASGLVDALPGRPDRNDSLLIGPTVQQVQTRQYVALMMLPLDRPGGWFVGASYRTLALTRMFTEAALGTDGMAALVETKIARLQAVTGPAAVGTGYDVGNQPMFAAMKARPDGTWIGPSPDGVVRVHAFRAVPDRNLSVVVAMTQSEALQPAQAWAAAQRLLAWSATAVALLAAAVALYSAWTYGSRARLREALQREEALFASGQVDLVEARTQLESREGQLETLLVAVDEGVAVFDPELRLMEWNNAFGALFRIAADSLHAELPLDDTLRQQARGGAFGPVEDVEAEVAQRIAQLRTAGLDGVRYAGPDGRPLLVRSSSHADGSLLLVVHPAAEAGALAHGGSSAMEPL